jgi:hypothetical protein
MTVGAGAAFARLRRQRQCARGEDGLGADTGVAPAREFGVAATCQLGRGAGGGREQH